MTKLEKAVGPMVWAYKQGFGTTAGDLMEYMESRDWTAFVEGLAELAAQGLGEVSGEANPGESAVRLGTPALFQSGEFTLHSGQKSNFKIDCDALTDDDIEAIALQLAWRLRFEFVIGVPRGGLRLAAALKKYGRILSPLLIVDDVLTTGGSMEKARADILAKDPDMPIIGAVIFSRLVPPPSWITPLFVLNTYTRG